MPNPEKEAFAEYAEMGIELPAEAEPQEAEVDTPAAPAPEAPVAPVVEEVVEAAPAVDEEPITPEPPSDTPKKRSIYENYKDKKVELKSETERAEAAEAERDELRTKLEAQESAANPAEQAADDEMATFAKEIGADPTALKRMQEMFLKGIPAAAQAQVPEGFAAWQKENSAAIDKVAFDAEFAASKPELDRMFSNVSPEESEALKVELNRLAHTAEFHDKELAYIAFKNQPALSALVSPKKPGMEQKGKADAAESVAYTFNPNADLSQMSAAEAEQWEKAYQQASSPSEGLQVDALGRKILI